jgi:hypothetical protein
MKNSNGTLVQRYGGYFIIQIIKLGVIPIQQKLFPVYPKDKMDESKLNTLVEFNLINESSHPELYKGVMCLKGTKYARLID